MRAILLVALLSSAAYADPITRLPDVQLAPATADAPVMVVAPTLVPRSNRGAAIPVELANLREELNDTSMFMPIAGIVAGGVVMLLGAALATGALYPNADNRLAGGVVVAGGTALLGTGIFLTTRRSSQRYELERRIAALKDEARLLGFVVPRERGED